MQAITSLARRTASMRPVALEVFMLPASSSRHHVRSDQARPCSLTRICTLALRASSHRLVSLLRLR